MRLTQRGVLPPVNFVELDASLQASILAPAGAKLVSAADIGVLTAAIASTATVALQVRGGGTRIVFTNVDGSVEEASIFTSGLSNLGIQPLNGNEFNLYANNGVSQLRVPGDDTGVQIKTRETGLVDTVGQIATFRIALCDFVGSTATINKSFRITSLTRTSAGVYTLNYTAAGFAAAPYIYMTTQENATTANHGAVGTTSVAINVRDNANVAVDARVHVMLVTS